MAQKTYTVSQSGTYKVRAVASNGRHADSNTIEVTLATVVSSSYRISPDGTELWITINIRDLNPDAGDNKNDGLTIYAGNDNTAQHKHVVNPRDIKRSESSGVTTLSAIVKMSELTTDTGFDRTDSISVYFTFFSNGIENYRLKQTSVILGLKSATYDITTDIVTVELQTDQTDPTYTAIIDGSLEFGISQTEASIAGDLTSGLTAKIENATSQFGSNAGKEVSLYLKSYTSSTPSFGLYGTAEIPTTVTVELLKAPVLTYDAKSRNLQWDEVTGATGYEVYKGDSKVTTVT